MSLVAIFQRRSAHTQSPRIKIRRRLLGRNAPIAALGVAAGLLSFGMVFAPTAHASTYTWDGTVNDWFASPSHWGPITPGSYPGTGDDAVNNFTAAMTLGSSTTIQSFFSNGAFSLNGGAFTGSLANAAGTIQVNALFTLNGGQINNFTVKQGTGGSVIVTGSGGNQINNSILNSNLDMNTNANADVDLNGTVTENGAITLGTTSNGIRLLNSGTSLNIGSAGSLTGFGSVHESQANTLNNNGIINANSATNALYLTLTNFTNSGTAKATSGGTLALASTNVTNNGTLAAFGLGSVVSLTGTITNGAGSLFTTTGGGQIQVNGAILSGTINTDSATALIYNGSGGNQIVGATINGNLDLATNANADLDLYGTVTENGNINLGTTSNGIRLVYAGASLNIGSGSSLTGFGSVHESQANTLNNNGIINANSATNALYLTLTNFTNSGTAKATSGGTLALASTNVTNNGTLAAFGLGSVVSLTGTITNGAGSLFTTTGGGQIQVNGAILSGTINTDSATALIYNGSGGNQIVGATINGNLDLATNANADLDLYGTVTENGNINLGTTSNGIRLVYAGASLNIGSGSSLIGFGSVHESQANTLNNNGLINANASGKSLDLAVTTFNNNKIAEATNGATLNLYNNTNNNAGSTLAAKSGGIVNFNGGIFTADAASTLDGAGGTFNVNGANLIGTLNGTTGTSLIFNGSGGNTLNNGTPAGTIETVNTNLDFATNVNANVDLYGTVTENGAITLGTTSNGIRLVSSGTSLTIGSGSSLTGFGSVHESQANTLNNNGLINANSPVTPLNLAVTTFNNNKIAEATNGATLNLYNNTNNNAGSTLAAKSGGIVNFNGGTTFTADAASTLDGAGGTFNVNGANLIGTLNGTAGTSLIFNGSGGNTLNNGTPAGTIETVNTNLDFATNVNANVDLYGTVTENGAITLGTTSNGIRLVSSGTSLTIGSGSSLTGFGSVHESQANTLNNNGLINANSPVTPLNLAVTTFNNNKIAEATNGATLNLYNNTNNNAGSTLAAKSGGIVNFNGGTTFTADAASTLDGAGGTFNINGVTLLGTLNGTAGTSLIFNGSGSNVINGVTINTNLDLATNANANVDLYGTVTENGAITLGTTSNGIRLVYSGASLNIGSAGSLTGFGSVHESQANTLNNGGTINANVTGQTLNINTTNFTNTGTTEVQNGAFLSVTSANTDSGNVLVNTGGTATFGQGLTQTAGTTQVDGTLNSALTLTGGILKGKGTVVGNVVNNGGTIAPGDSPGKLAITGAFTQNSGTFSIEFNNTAHDVLAVSGLATTGGLLDVNYIGTGASTGVGSIFDILDYGSVATSLTGSQFFSNQGAGGLITGHNGFTYTLINDIVNNQLQLKELTAGNPVPETSSVVSLGLLLALGLGALTVNARRRKAVH